MQRRDFSWDCADCGFNGQLQQGFASGGIGFRGQFAQQQFETAYVRFGSVVSSGRRNTLSQTQEMEWMGDGSKIHFEVSMRWPRRSCGTAGGTHSQFNRVARQLNERSRETLGFETELNEI